MKGNQEKRHRAIIEHIGEQLDGDLAGAREHVTTEKGHGREETRTYLQLPAPKSLPGFAQWKGLKSMGVVTSWCLRDGTETIEVRYYISREWRQDNQKLRPLWTYGELCPITILCEHILSPPRDSLFRFWARHRQKVVRLGAALDGSRFVAVRSVTDALLTDQMQQD